MENMRKTKLLPRKRRMKEKKIVTKIKKFTYFKTKDINGLDLELSNFCRVDTRI